MINSQFPITYPIPLYIKGLTITFWLKSFAVDTMPSNRYVINYPNASLYMQVTKDRKVFQTLSDDAKKKLSYQINENNLQDIKEIFSIALNWLSNENKKELYAKNDDGVLVFNSDFRTINAKHIDKYNTCETGIKLIPSITEIANGVMEPAIIMYINNSDNYLILREYEFKRIAYFIRNFNFITYINFTLQCMSYCNITGNILTVEQVQQRMEKVKQYDTNMRF